MPRSRAHLDRTRRSAPMINPRRSDRARSRLIFLDRLRRRGEIEKVVDEVPCIQVADKIWDRREIYSAPVGPMQGETDFIAAPKPLSAQVAAACLRSVASRGALKWSISCLEACWR